MRLRFLVLDAIFLTLIIALKEALAFLPNVEVVTLIFMVVALLFPLRDSFLIAFSYATIEGLLYGFSIFSVSYYLVFILIVLITHFFLKKPTYLKAALFSFFYGLFFDVIFALPLLASGIKATIAYLLNGLLFSLAHAVFNFIIALFLFEGLYKLLKTLLERYGQYGVK